MHDKTHSQIELAISKRKAGEIVFLADFRGKGTQAVRNSTP